MSEVAKKYTIEKYTLGEVLFTRQQIEARASEIGAQISKDYAGEELLFVGILRGAVMWMSEVLKSVDNTKAQIDFMAVSSYGASTKSSGVVRINKDLEMGVEGKHVLLVEDIVDTGTTLSYLAENIKARGPKSVGICALLDKPSRRQVPVDIRYTGFEVDDVFIVGFGLDVAQHYRNLPHITSVTVNQ